MDGRSTELEVSRGFGRIRARALGGALGSLVGIVRVLQGMEAAGEFLSPLVAPGMVMFTLSGILGVAILGLSALMWFFLQLRWRLLKAAVSDV